MPLRSSTPAPESNPDQKKTSPNEEKKPVLPIGEFSLANILKGTAGKKEAENSAGKETIPSGVGVKSQPIAPVAVDKSKESVFGGDVGSAQEAIVEAEFDQVAGGGEEVFLGEDSKEGTTTPGTDDPFDFKGKPEATDLSSLVVQNDTQLPAIATPANSFFFTTFGQEVPRYPINRFKATEGVKSRAAIPFVDKIAIAKIHFNTSIGYYYCFSGICCSLDGLPGIRYVLPWVVYDTDKSAKVVSSKYEIFYLQLGEDDYKDFKALNESVPINDVDYLVTCNDEAYQKNTYQNVGPALWKHPKSPLKDEVPKKFEEVWPLLPKVIARTLDETMFMKMLNERSREPHSKGAAQPIANLASFLRK